MYVWTGFWAAEVPPSPNDQAHVAGESVDASTNWTLSGTVPDVAFETNNATGAVFAAVTVIYVVLLIVVLPAVFDAVRVTV
jgi:hypothetical protein